MNGCWRLSCAKIAFKVRKSTRFIRFRTISQDLANEWSLIVEFNRWWGTIGSRLEPTCIARRSMKMEKKCLVIFLILKGDVLLTNNQGPADKLKEEAEEEWMTFQRPDFKHEETDFVFLLSKCSKQMEVKDIQMIDRGVFICIRVACWSRMFDTKVIEWKRRIKVCDQKETKKNSSINDVGCVGGTNHSFSYKQNFSRIVAQWIPIWSGYFISLERKTGGVDPHESKTEVMRLKLSSRATDPLMPWYFLDFVISSFSVQPLTTWGPRSSGKRMLHVSSCDIPKERERGSKRIGWRCTLYFSPERRKNSWRRADIGGALTACSFLRTINYL